MIGPPGGLAFPPTHFRLFLLHVSCTRKYGPDRGEIDRTSPENASICTTLRGTITKTARWLQICGETVPQTLVWAV